MQSLKELRFSVANIYRNTNFGSRRYATIEKSDETMSDAYVYVWDLCQQAKVPENGIF